MLQVRYQKDTVLEAGIDEAGRGCLWGPLFAAAVIWPPEEEMTEDHFSIGAQIKDSKKLSAKKRDLLAASIKDLAIAWGVGQVSAAEIDALGMTKSNQLAFTRALEALGTDPERLLIDGTLGIMNMPWSMVEQIVEPEADGKYLPVAAASILAKTGHDEWIKKFVEVNSNLNLHERYDLMKNKGYGTAKHRNGIVQHGCHKEHRQLFLRKLYAGLATKGDAAVEEAVEDTVEDAVGALKVSEQVSNDKDQL